MAASNYPQMLSGGAVEITTSATSASVAIPNDSAGNRARCILVASTQPARFRVGNSGLTAVATDTLIQPQNNMALFVAGHTHIAAIQEGAPGKVSITPLDDQR